MATRRYLEKTPNGADQYFVEQSDGTFLIETHQDLEPLLEHNKRLQNSGHDGFNKERDRVHVGTIPAIIIHKWLLEDGFNALAIHDPDVQRKLKQKLNDPQYAYLRTSNIRL